MVEEEDWAISPTLPLILEKEGGLFEHRGIVPHPAFLSSRRAKWMRLSMMVQGDPSAALSPPTRAVHPPAPCASLFPALIPVSSSLPSPTPKQLILWSRK